MPRTQSSRRSGITEDQSQPTRTPPPVAALRPSKTKEFDTAEIAKINAWTVGLAAGQLEGAPLRFATDISRVVDDGDNLHVLPIVTRGPTENVEALLYLKGVDVAIINADTLEQFMAKIPDIQQRITYILSLFPSELHIFVRPDIKSLDDLRGKKVNFNTQGTAAAYSGPLIFDKLKLDVQKNLHSASGGVGADALRHRRYGSRRVHHVEADRRLLKGQVAAGLQVLAGSVSGFQLLSAGDADFD